MHCPRVRKLCRVLSQLKHGKEEAMPCSIFSVTRQSISALAVLYFLEHGKGQYTAKARLQNTAKDLFAYTAKIMQFKYQTTTIQKR
jgi:hypothetical protein